MPASATRLLPSQVSAQVHLQRLAQAEVGHKHTTVRWQPFLVRACCWRGAAMDVAHAPPPLPPEPCSNHFSELPPAHDAPPLPADDDADAPPLPPEEVDEPPAQPAERQQAEPGAGAGAGPGSANGAPVDLLTAELDPEEDPLLVAEARRAAEGEAGDGPPADEPMWPAEDPDAVKLSTEEEEALLKVRASRQRNHRALRTWRASLCSAAGPASHQRGLWSTLRWCKWLGGGDGVAQGAYCSKGRCQCGLMLPDALNLDSLFRTVLLLIAHTPPGFC